MRASALYSVAPGTNCVPGSKARKAHRARRWRASLRTRKASWQGSWSISEIRFRSLRAARAPVRSGAFRADCRPGTAFQPRHAAPPAGLPTSLVDDFLLADYLLLQRLAVRLDHFSRLQTQGQVVPALPQEGVHFPDEDGFALFGKALQCSADQFGFERQTEPLIAGLRGIRENPRRSGEVPGKLGAYVLDHFFKLRSAQQIGLGEQYSDFRCVLVKALQQIDITLRKGWIDADRHQCEPHIRQPVQRCLRVVRKRALQARRIDELQPAKSPQFGQFHGDQVDLPGVLRVFLLGDVEANLVERNLEIVAIVSMNPRLFA